MQRSCCSIRGWHLALMVGVGRWRGGNDDALVPISRQALGTDAVALVSLLVPVVVVDLWIFPRCLIGCLFDAMNKNGNHIPSLASELLRLKIPKTLVTKIHLQKHLASQG